MNRYYEVTYQNSTTELDTPEEVSGFLNGLGLNEQTLRRDVNVAEVDHDDDGLLDDINDYSATEWLERLND